ncbi:FAD binding domain-containing protein [Rhodobacter sp. Har01]|uniref:FAD binding domain-containing protein n=1 Tax=Rhodobacter sp. Har01 TaxID=2883999 RepID=UPI001D081842|nr:FAD binding domain-containing protein [Rhodobacter sp. Har01]MCB6177083.1 FAD binding domain-containing protein [Rhodobacter sp. Har01]
MDYLRPASLSEVFPALAAGARVLAGGTDVYPGQGARIAGPVVDLTALPGFRGITRDAGGLRIGACTRWTDLAEAALPPACAALQQAARQVGGRQIQNAGTLGGNLCNASPAADGVPPLLALEAEVELVSVTGPRRVPLSAFLLGPRKVDLRPGEVLAAVCVPQAALAGVSAFEKLGARAYLVISIAMAAVRLEVAGGAITRAAVSVGACGPVALRLAPVEAALVGPVQGAVDRARAADFSALSPIDDVRATAAYRRSAAVELVARAVGRCL